MVGHFGCVVLGNVVVYEFGVCVVGREEEIN